MSESGLAGIKTPDCVEFELSEREHKSVKAAVMGRRQHLCSTTTLLSTLTEERWCFMCNGFHSRAFCLEPPLAVLCRRAAPWVCQVTTSLQRLMSSGTGKGHPAVPLLAVDNLDDAVPEPDHVKYRVNRGC